MSGIAESLLDQSSRRSSAVPASNASCGEFVLHVRGALACPECRTILAESEERIAQIALPSVMQAG